MEVHIIYDGSSEHDAHVSCEIGLFQEKIRFDDSFEVTKCLKQIEMSYWLYMCVSG